MTSTQTVDAEAVSRALANATTAASHAPSIHDARPWRWRAHGDRLDLSVDGSRTPAGTDLARRLAILSCGAALHHALISLAADGRHTTVTRLPDQAKAGHLATVRVNGRITVEPTAIRHLQTIALRHTDRRGQGGIAVGADTLRPIAAAAESHQTLLHLLRPRQILDLAFATDDARRIESANQAWQAELRDWGGTGSPRTGTPDTAILPEASTATVPGRNSGRSGDMTVADTQDQTAAFAILYGPGDSDLDWLRAGEALSAVCLKATESGVSVLPLSSTIEVGATREIVKHLLPGPGHPYLVLRFGVLDATASGPSRTPRLPAGQIAVQP